PGQDRGRRLPEGGEARARGRTTAGAAWPGGGRSAWQLRAVGRGGKGMTAGQQGGAEPANLAPGLWDISPPLCPGCPRTCRPGDVRVMSVFASRRRAGCRIERTFLWEGSVRSSRPLREVRSFLVTPVLWGMSRRESLPVSQDLPPARRGALAVRRAGPYA